MTRLAIAFEPALVVDQAAAALARRIEATLGGPGAVSGACVQATAAGGVTGEAVGRRLAERWPEAELVGTSFEGLVFEGRVVAGEPAVAVLAWSAGPGAPIPFACPAREQDPEVLAKEVLSAAGRGHAEAGDLVVLFPDALDTPGLDALLGHFDPTRGGPWLAGAAAVGVDGSPAHAWMHPMDGGSGQWLIGLLIPRLAAGALEAAPVRAAGGTRAASPWLEISACRSHWIDGLEGEPPFTWIRRQLGLADDEALAPHFDRLFVRLARRDAQREHGRDPAAEGRSGAVPGPDPNPGREPAPRHFEERHLTGVDPRRGSIGVLGSYARRDLLAFALPDPAVARESLREAVAALPAGPILLQFACPGRGESLHGDPDLESAIIAHAAAGRSTLGVIAPFQLASDAEGTGRQRVYTTVLAVIGSGTGENFSPERSN